MKKFIALCMVFFIIFALVQPSYAGSWWKKIIRKMMREGVKRTDLPKSPANTILDDEHAVRMAYDAYVLAPRAFSGDIDFVDFNIYIDVEDDVDVKKDVASGEYGPVSFEEDALEIITKSTSQAAKSKMISDRVNFYKLQAMSRLTSYLERANKLKEDLKEWRETDIDNVCGLSLESIAGVMSEKSEVMANGIALKTYMNELLALKNAVTGEIALLGTVNYANMVSESLNGTMEIYDLVR
ncbi:MAG: hypothetical protein WBK47_08950 [Acetomicrobium sp.]